MLCAKTSYIWLIKMQRMINKISVPSMSFQDQGCTLDFVRNGRFIKYVLRWAWYGSSDQIGNFCIIKHSFSMMLLLWKAQLTWNSVFLLLFRHNWARLTMFASIDSSKVLHARVSMYFHTAAIKVIFQNVFSTSPFCWQNGFNWKIAWRQSSDV